ncbi:carboxymuconolactone decarboxylase family protein [Dyadobacter beijingensis]|nr:carboxymuconolactone decarboxylase family protein [Dyadobacter beijingensis]
MDINAQNNGNDGQSLDARQQSIVAISAATATGDLPALKTSLATGLDAGLPVNQAREVLVHLYAYCGFPRSLNGINTLMALLSERKAQGIVDQDAAEPEIKADTTDKYEKGRKVLEALTKVPQAKPAPGFGGFAPRIDAFLKEHLFADVFESSVLTYQQRELATISALAAMTGLESQLKSHLSMGANTGLTPNQLTQVISQAGKQHAGTAQVLSGKAINASPWIVRLAKIEIDPNFLDQYKAAIDEHTHAALESEPGVLTLYAMTEELHPTRVTVLEIYASAEAYQAHLKTAHFIKYKTGTQKMVKSLELVEVDAIAFGLKSNLLQSEK